MTGAAERTGALDRAARYYSEHDGVFYALFATACTVYAAASFYGSMHAHTRGMWSAPLDDVFIHFDYARSFARGYPFQWSEGNGYSSGNTSLSYPVALALGYWLGFRELRLAIWAAGLAVVAVVVFFCGAGKLVDRLSRTPPPRWLKYLLPPAVLSMGVLDWSLFSGMENAWHLGAWGLAAMALVRQAEAQSARIALRRAWLTGAAGALLFSARPESGVCVACFALSGAWLGRRRGPLERWRDTARAVGAAASPALALLGTQAVANRLLTGDWAASGSVAKLIVHNPFLTAAEKWERYQQLFDYITHRLRDYHFADATPWGWLPLGLALLPLGSRALCPVALVVWPQIGGWIGLVCLNSQLRWHNERYAMPAVAWLMLLAALGVGVLLGHATALGADASRSCVRLGNGWRRSWPARALLGLAIVAAYWRHQAPRMQNELWFFGRACRNILDQHVTAALVLKQLGVKRVLVGDAGALTYISDRPGLDLIGLGGYHALPFARSGVHGVGALIELLEHLPIRDRPDIMAIYPSWWDELPVFFGRQLLSVPATGNVICGGPEKVIYRADWHALDAGGRPCSLHPGERVMDELDVADLLSERAHHYDFPRPGKGYVFSRVLGDPSDSHRDLFDAGREIPADETARATMRTVAGGARLVVRLAPGAPATVAVLAAGRELGRLAAPAAPGTWVEPSIALPADLEGEIEIGLRPIDKASVHFHVWIVK